MRPGTAAVVKMSASLDCDAVSPLGSVVKPGHLLTGTFGEECVLQTSESSSISQPRKLRLELRRTESALPGR